MKKNGSIIEYGAERDAVLLRAFRHRLLSDAESDMQVIVADIVSSQAPRYWVSEERVLRVLTLTRLGKNPLQGMRAPKRRMFEDIMQRVEALRREHPGRPLAEVITQVIYSPAPEHYMSVNYARQRIYKAIRDGRRDGRKGCR